MEVVQLYPKKKKKKKTKQRIKKKSHLQPTVQWWVLHLPHKMCFIYMESMTEIQETDGVKKNSRRSRMQTSYLCSGSIFQLQEDFGIQSSKIRKCNKKWHCSQKQIFHPGIFYSLQRISKVSQGGSIGILLHAWMTKCFQCI